MSHNYPIIQRNSSFRAQNDPKICIFQKKAIPLHLVLINIDSMDSIYIEPQKALQLQNDYEAEVKKCFGEALYYYHPDIRLLRDKYPKDAPTRKVIECLNSLCGAWLFFLTISKYELLQVPPTDLLSIFEFDIAQLKLTPSDCYDSLNNILPSYAEYALRSIYKDANVSDLDRLILALQNHNKKGFSAFVDTSSNEWVVLSELCSKFWLVDCIINILTKSCYNYRGDFLDKEERSFCYRGTHVLLRALGMLRASNDYPIDGLRLKLMQASLHPAYKYLVHSHVMLKKARTGIAMDALLTLIKCQGLKEWYDADYEAISHNPDRIFEEQPFIDFKNEQVAGNEDSTEDRDETEDNQQGVEECPLADIKNEQKPIHKKALDEAKAPTENEPIEGFFERIDAEKIEKSPHYTMERYELMLRDASMGDGKSFATVLNIGIRQKYINIKGVRSKAAFFRMVKAHFRISDEKYDSKDFCHFLMKKDEWKKYRDD